MGEFVTNHVELSLRNAETGRALTANVYKMTFDDGSYRVMSMGQLVMAVCLDRAVEKEDAVVAMMEEMARTTEKIEVISDIENKVLEASEPIYLNTIKGSWTVTDEYGIARTYGDAESALVATGLTISATTQDEIINSLESKLDELNTMSQSQMISLQSETNKRDQSYEMISNVVKSFYTVLCGTANNI